MSQNTSMVFNDKQATPVAHTFTPISTQNGIAKWRDNDSAVTLGLRPNCSASLRPGSLGNSVTREKRVKRKVVLKVAVPFQPPVVDGITPAVDTAECELRISIPLDAPVITYEDLLTYLRQMTSTVPVSNMIAEGEFPY